MDTRLARYCDRVVEACWLAAVALTPLFFNIFSSRVFEPDKLTLLRSIALLMALAWLVRTLERASGARCPLKASFRSPGSFTALLAPLFAEPLLPQIALLVLVYLIATAFSVIPHVSFWGSYQRLQGTYTFLAYIVIFSVTWQSLRTRPQLERLLNVIILTSLPVALYGVLQHYGLDPLPWAGSTRDRVTANLGNAIFIGAYLIMAFCLTLERLIARFHRLRNSPEASLTDSAAAGVYFFILALQILALFFCQSRGPWLGLLGGVYVFIYICLVAMGQAATRERPFCIRDGLKATAFALLSPLPLAVSVWLGLTLQRITLFGLLGLGLFLATYLALIWAKRGKRWLWLSWFLQALLAVVVLIGFNLPNSPLAPLRNVPGIGRLGQVFETGGGTGRVRVLIWEGSVEMIGADPLRALVGYGPESMYVAYNPFYPPDLAHYEARNASPDRAHNETFDALIQTGFAGFLAYMALFVGIFYQGLRWLGLLPPPGPDKRAWQRALFLGLAVGGAILGTLIPLAVDRSLRFAGVGIPIGLIVGVVLYLAIAAFVAPQREATTVKLGERELLLAGLLAMVVAHFVEIHFGIAIAATRTHFWVGLAILLNLGSRRLRLEQPHPAPVRPCPMPAETRSKHSQRKRAALRSHPAAPPERSARRVGLTAGLITALLLATIFFDLATLTQSSSGEPPYYHLPLATALLLALTWVLGALLVVSEGQSLPQPLPMAWWRRALAWHLGSSGIVGVLCALLHLAVLTQGREATLVIYEYYAVAFGLLLLLAAALARPAPPTTRLRGARAWGYLVPLVAALWLINGNINVVRADIYYKQGWDGYHRPAIEGLTRGTISQTTAQRAYDIALDFYKRALQCAPQEDYYLLFHGKALLERGEITAEPELMATYFRNAEQTLLRAHQVNPLNTDHMANLARLHRTWALYSTDAQARQELVARAISEYEAAIHLSPHNAVLYNELSLALQDQGQPDQALERLQQSLALDDRFDQTYRYLGELYASQENWPQALAAYQKGIEIAPGYAVLHAGLGYVYSQMGYLTEAISENLKVLELAPRNYVAAKNLALLYRDTGEIQQALAMARQARELAPESEQAALDQLIAQLESALQPEGNP